MKKMNVVRKAHGESCFGVEYVSPETKVVLLQPEGILCSSVYGDEHESFSLGDEYVID